MKFTKVAYVGMIVAAMALPVFALALATPSPNVPGQPVTLTEIENIIRTIANFLIIVSVIIAVIMIIWGGILYMWARGDDKRTETARKTIFNGIIGAAVVLAVGVILQTVAGLVTRTFFG
ncbi:MAG: TrbC/VirB2 family protein [Planctomycetota bacterium]